MALARLLLSRRAMALARLLASRRLLALARLLVSRRLLASRRPMALARLLVSRRPMALARLLVSSRLMAPGTSVGIDRVRWHWHVCWHRDVRWHWHRLLGIEPSDGHWAPSVGNRTAFRLATWQRSWLGIRKTVPMGTGPTVLAWGIEGRSWMGTGQPSCWVFDHRSRMGHLGQRSGLASEEPSRMGTWATGLVGLFQDRPWMGTLGTGPWLGHSERRPEWATWGTVLDWGIKTVPMALGTVCLVSTASDGHWHGPVWYSRRPMGTWARLLVSTTVRMAPGTVLVGFNTRPDGPLGEPSWVGNFKEPVPNGHLGATVLVWGILNQTVPELGTLGTGLVWGSKNPVSEWAPWNRLVGTSRNRPKLGTSGNPACLGFSKKPLLRLGHSLEPVPWFWGP